LLRLPRRFIVQLLEETDWAFVIRLNAVFESLLSVGIAQILQAVHSTGLQEIDSKLDMADPRRSKVVIAAEMGIIASEDKRFMLALAELRNKLAHSIAD